MKSSRSSWQPVTFADMTGPGFQLGLTRWVLRVPRRALQVESGLTFCMATAAVLGVAWVWAYSANGTASWWAGSPLAVSY